MADPKASDPIEDTSSQVNLAILSSLERLNEGMAQLTDFSKIQLVVYYQCCFLIG